MLMSERQDSNLRPLRPKRSALIQTELRSDKDQDGLTRNYTIEPACLQVSSNDDLVRRPCAAPTGFEPAYTTVTG